MLGANDGHCIVTLVERTSRFTLIGKLRARTTAELNRRVIWLIQRHMTDVRTITADNGTEFHQFEDVENATGTDFYFCDPYHSWQRGTNENTNGLLRQYFPKGTDLSRWDAEEIQAVAATINSRPRKILGWRTPAEALDEHLRSLQQPGVATTD